MTNCELTKCVISVLFELCFDDKNFSEDAHIEVTKTGKNVELVYRALDTYLGSGNFYLSLQIDKCIRV